MKDSLAIFERIVQCLMVSNRGVDKCAIWLIYIRNEPCRQVVENDNIVSFRNQPPSQIRANKSSATRDSYFCHVGNSMTEGINLMKSKYTYRLPMTELACLQGKE